MTYVTLVDDLPIYENLLEELHKVLPNWATYRSVCLNSPIGINDHQFGNGSLYYDWTKKTKVVNDRGEVSFDVPLRDLPLKETDFVELCSIFTGTVFEEIYQTLLSKYVLGRVRIMTSQSNSCLSWHVDDTRRLHYPIKTQEGCFMVIEDTVNQLEQNKWYLTDTTVKHTAFNGSKDARVHLVACIVKERND